jgi:hypothetical protein
VVVTPVFTTPIRFCVIQNPCPVVAKTEVDCDGNPSSYGNPPPY